MPMTITEIEYAIEGLSPDEISKLSKWFEEFESRVWDSKIARDIENGKLQPFISEAERDFDEGDTKPL
jgi:hypothetical protein